MASAATLTRPPKQGLTLRWTPLRPHTVQSAMMACKARYNICPAGRRSGKTELLGKRKLVLRALLCHDPRYPAWYCPQPDPRFAVAAPTRDQVKRIYWRDLKALIPRQFMAGKPNESQLIITLVNGAEICLWGMDRPERAEGVGLNHIVMDEFGNMKEDAWGEHVQPALSDRQGSADFPGVPEGRNHYHRLYERARAQEIEDPDSAWRTWHWFSADILPPEEIAQARRDLDPLVFQQEYEGSFVNFTGLAYYNWDPNKHLGKLKYERQWPLLICFDFNRAPGCAVIMQEQQLPSGEYGPGVIGEVWIPRNSNTPMVARKVITDWGKHPGPIRVYGDATGGRKMPSSVLGSDWQLIKEIFWAAWPAQRCAFKVPKANPGERERVNSMNSLLLSHDGRVRLMVDPKRAPNVVRDFEGVIVVEGGSGEIDKDADEMLTHLTDAMGYFAWREYPIKKQYAPSGQKHWK